MFVVCFSAAATDWPHLAEKKLSQRSFFFLSLPPKEMIFCLHYSTYMSFFSLSPTPSGNLKLIIIKNKPQISWKVLKNCHWLSLFCLAWMVCGQLYPLNKKQNKQASKKKKICRTKPLMYIEGNLKSDLCFCLQAFDSVISQTALMLPLWITEL